ncbi:MAG: hypothetical protein JRJ79_11015 [Deltaproteobacteria bacterium]|nr:hypothetical protein [Deltaproteobacteria bacterium]MBW1792958.1 hypothetical protein [Deltaproteobacteria bacterium]
MTVPKVKYLSPSPHGYVPLNDITSQTPMRLTRSGADTPHGPALTYGLYFKGITDIISKDGYKLLVDATARQLAEDISLSDIEEILIHAEKHGSDYHPARIEVMVGDVCAAFVMNVAVTARGKDRLSREFEVLQHLNTKHDFPFLLRTYFQGEAFYGSGRGGDAMLMFLADWFQGYHEFHLSLDNRDGSQKLVLWDTEKNPCHLSRPQAWQIYSQAARILTLYYDLETFEQIFPWHHAAGDFVVKTQEKSIDVRLVTARQYAPMLERSEGVSVHEGLLFFLLNLSVRMRLDRLDGVGAVAWADDRCVDATLKGFVEGVRIKQDKGFVDAGFVNGFLQYLCSLGKEDLSYRFHILIDACDQAAPDIPVIRSHLERHISNFHLALQDLRDS